MLRCSALARTKPRPESGCPAPQPPKFPPRDDRPPVLDADLGRERSRLLKPDLMQSPGSIWLIIGLGVPSLSCRRSVSASQNSQNIETLESSGLMSIGRPQRMHLIVIAPHLLFPGPSSSLSHPSAPPVLAQVMCQFARRLAASHKCQLHKVL